MNFQEALDTLKNTSPLRITISGDIGSGKSTFAKHLAEELDIPRTYIGGLMREEATRRGMTLDDFGKLLETDDTVDRQMDELQAQRSRETERGVFEGRTSWHFVENPTVKMFVAVDPRVAAERIFGDRDPLRDTYTSVDEVMQANANRKEVEMARYQKYYGIDVYDLNNFDVVIDTTNLSIEETFEKAVIAIAQYALTKR